MRTLSTARVCLTEALLQVMIFKLYLLVGSPIMAVVKSKDCRCGCQPLREPAVLQLYICRRPLMAVLVENH